MSISLSTTKWRLNLSTLSWKIKHLTSFFLSISIKCLMPPVWFGCLSRSCHVFPFWRRLRVLALSCTLWIQWRIQDLHWQGTEAGSAFGFRGNCRPWWCADHCKSPAEFCALSDSVGYKKLAGMLGVLGRLAVNALRRLRFFPSTSFCVCS